MTVDALSPREREVLLLIGDGYSRDEIARRLGITHWTVDDHRKHARDKLGAASTTQAVVMLVRGPHPAS